MTVTVLVPEGALSDTAARLHPPLELETALLDAEAKMLPFASFASQAQDRAGAGQVCFRFDIGGEIVCSASRGYILRHIAVERFRGKIAHKDRL